MISWVPCRLTPPGLHAFQLAASSGAFVRCCDHALPLYLVPNNHNNQQPQHTTTNHNNQPQQPITTTNHNNNNNTTTTQQQHNNTTTLTTLRSHFGSSRGHSWPGLSQWLSHLPWVCGFIVFLMWLGMGVLGMVLFIFFRLVLLRLVSRGILMLWLGLDLVCP